MSSLLNIISELMPDGVKHRKLLEVVELKTGDQVNRRSLSDSNPYPVYNGGVGVSGWHTQYNTPAGTTTISQGGASAGYVNFVKEDFWAGAHCYVAKPAKGLNDRYLYFALKSQESFIQAAKTGAGIPGLSRASLSKLAIPLPPLEVQLEIVRILDTFTQLEAELQAELEARKKQYEHYRNSLLSFPEQGGVRWVPMGDVVRLVNDRVQKSSVSNRYVGVENLAQNCKGLSSTGFFSSETGIEFLPEDILIGNIRPYLRKIWQATFSGGTNGDVLTLRSIDPNLTLSPKFLKQILSSENFWQFAIATSKGAKMPRGDKRAIMSFEIPIPPMEAQLHIASSLEQFDCLVNDISNGLPAEMSSRRKQYEHYRDRLLNFKEIAA